MQVWNVYYDGEFCGEATLSSDWDTAQVDAYALLKQSNPDVQFAFVSARRVK